MQLCPHTPLAATMLCAAATACGNGSEVEEYQGKDASPSPDASGQVPETRDAGWNDAQTDAGVVDAQVPVCTFFADPVSGSADGSGSADSPWGPLNEVMASDHGLSAGDVLCLLDGHHGSPRISDLSFEEDLLIVAHQGAVPRISELDLRNAHHIAFEGLVIDLTDEKQTDTDEKEHFVIRGDEATTDIVFRDLTVRSTQSIDGWTKEDWYTGIVSGMDMRGERIRVEHSRFENLYHAVSLRGDHSYLGHTVIDNFAGDAIRGLGSFSTYEWNTVRDAYIDDYAIQHDDGFQAYRLDEDPKIEGVTIRNNRFLQFADPMTSFIVEHELASSLMQGIINTDGYVDGWVVENNLVVGNHSAGIVLQGARHCRIQNNTVVQSPRYNDLDVPSILVREQSKTGQENFQNIIRNNLSTKLTTWTFDESSTVESNIDLNEANLAEIEATFTDFSGLDFSLRPTSDAVDSGTNTDVAVYDVAGEPRVSGNGVDCGAYELSQSQSP